MASEKQTQYVREAWGDGEHGGKSTVYYIDIRATDRLEDFCQRVRKDATKNFVESKLAKIVESAFDHHAQVFVTPCLLCHANIEVYQSEINKRQGTKLSMPVLNYSQLMTVAHGGNAQDAGLNGHLIRTEALEKIAGKWLAASSGPGFLVGAVFGPKQDCQALAVVAPIERSRASGTIPA